jgi:hypothetical protein
MKQDVSAWNKFIWFRRETMCGLLWTLYQNCNEHLAYTKFWELTD